MSKNKSLYPCNEHEIMNKQLRISTIRLILILLLTVGFFIFAFIAKEPTIGGLII